VATLMREHIFEASAKGIAEFLRSKQPRPPKKRIEHKEGTKDG
jgi:hypothetical protein